MIFIWRPSPASQWMYQGLFSRGFGSFRVSSKNRKILDHAVSFSTADGCGSEWRRWVWEKTKKNCYAPINEAGWSWWRYSLATHVVCYSQTVDVLCGRRLWFRFSRRKKKKRAAVSGSRVCATWSFLPGTAKDQRMREESLSLCRWSTLMNRDHIRTDLP